MVKTLIQHIASTQEAIENCIASNNQEWVTRHNQSLAALEKLLPSGAGIDCGTKIVSNEPHKIVFSVEFHVMTDGSYDGWENFLVVVCPSFGGLDIDVRWFRTNHDRDTMEDLADYLHEVFSSALEASYADVWDATTEEISFELV